MKLYLKEGKWVFDYQNSKYYIPSALYPLTFNPEDTNIYAMTDKQVSEIRDLKILNLLDSIFLPVGRCYDNSEKIYQMLKNEGYKVGYFSGWLFLGNTLPLHHAWVVMEHEDEIHIIDSAYHKISETIVEEMEGLIFKSVDKSREYFLKVRNKLIEEKKRNTDRITTGKPPDGYVYIGTDNSYEETRKTYIELTKIRNHPSYGEGMNIRGDSVLQKMIKESEMK